MRVTVVGIGYVGLSLSIALSRYNNVTLVDIDESKVRMINKKHSPLEEKAIHKALKESTNIFATIDGVSAYKNSEVIILALPTDLQCDGIDTSVIEKVVDDILQVTRHATIVIKSTVPIGFTKSLKLKFHYDDIVFSPEFLREGFALYDNLHPSRIIVSKESPNSKKIMELLIKVSTDKTIPQIFASSSEAEAIKLFSNAFLALKVSFFNELDIFAELKSLNTKNIITGVCSDPRIGFSHSNPSFGFGGYCLPKDTQQLQKQFQDIPSMLIKNIPKSNLLRKEYIVKNVQKNNVNTVGIFRMNAKLGSDNCRNSASLDIIKILIENKINVVIYEPLVSTDTFLGCKIVNNFNMFCENSDIILANRFDPCLENIRKKIYTRDFFNEC